MIPESLEYAKYVVEHNHTTANYYEDKKHKFLYLATGVLGFSISFMGFVGNVFLLRIGALIALIFSFLAIAYYSIFSFPSYETKTLELQKVRKMSQDDVLGSYVDQANQLKKMYDTKAQSIKIMGLLIVVGIAGFSISAIIYALSLF